MVWIFVWVLLGIVVIQAIAITIFVSHEKEEWERIYPEPEGHAQFLEPVTPKERFDSSTNIQDLLK